MVNALALLDPVTDLPEAMVSNTLNVFIAGQFFFLDF
jgi:hypothetical protein